jgi:predicted RNA-binding protein (virulence factor B family)
MIEVGKFNKLSVESKKDHGYYLIDDVSKERVLLPNSSLEGNVLEIGEKVIAFIYRDSKDRIIATFKKPLAEVDNLAYLEVVSNTNIGSFINFGLDRDILVPIKERLYDLIPGKKYLFYIYLDKTNRLAATTDIEKYLEITDKYKINEEAIGTVYGFQQSGNIMIALENLYKAIILKNEYFDIINIGDNLNIRVKKYYEDGTIGVTTRKKSREERDILQEKILKYLKENNGFMPYNDKSSPEDIKRVFNESKNYFKKSLGNLMKKKLIFQYEEGTKLLENYKIHKK